MSDLLRIRPFPEALRQAVRQVIASRGSPNTRAAYAADWGRWEAFCGRAGADAAQVALVHAVAFREALAEEGLAPASIVRILTTVSFLYRALVDAGLATGNPFSRAWLPRPKIGPERRTRSVTDAQAGALIEAAELAGPREAALLRLLYDTGIRRMSAAGARWADLDLGRGELRVAVKGGADRVAHLTPECARALAALPRSSPYVFGGRDKRRPINLATVNRIVAQVAAAAGVEGVHPHRFRAAFITDGYDAKLSERDIQAAAHHADAATTRGYDRGTRGESVVEQVAEFRKERRGKKT